MRLLSAAPLALAACSTGPTGPMHTFDPCTPVAIVAADGATDDERAGVAAARTAWRAVARIQFADDAPDGQRVSVRFASAALAFYGLYEGEDAVPDIVINSDLTDADARAIAIAHEIGHAFGMVHISGRSSVMNAGNITVVPNSADAVDLAAIWGACP